MLRDLGHGVVEAARASEALTLLAGNDPFDVLIVDLALPDMRGDAMIEKACDIRGGLRVVFASGHHPQSLKLDGSKVRYVFLPKPYDTAQMAEVLAKLT